uniref:Uncharacterized protein n=1 Tax=Arundo donax TaxID=35708 RepID=A0A0A8ZDF3_ARUDO
MLRMTTLALYALISFNHDVIHSLALPWIFNLWFYFTILALIFCNLNVTHICHRSLF